MSVEVKVLLASQEEIHGRMSRSVENLKKLGVANITRSAVETRITILDQLWERFERQHDLIRSAYKEHFDKSEYAVSNLLETVENTYVRQKSLLAQHAETFSNAGPSSRSVTENRSEGASKAALPRITLPRFSGAYEDWPSFRDLFLSVIGESSAISNVEKLHYLRSCLSGPAENLIRALSVTGDNYNRAWSMLIKHYENKRELIRSTFATFTAVAKMKTDTADELSRIFHAVSAAVNAQESINRPIGSHGMDLFNFLVVELFDPRTRLEWETSLSDASKPPEHETLMDFMSKRILTLNAARAKPASKTAIEPSRSAKSHLAKRGPDSTRCVLCKEKHPIMHCNQFKAKSASDRKVVVETHRLCYNCLGNHTVSKCQSSRNCFTCKGRHHTMLHDANNAVGATESTAVSATQFAKDKKAILLATARVLVSDRYGERHEARCLIDQGSEVSIISESLVQRLHLRRSHTDITIVGIGGTTTGNSRGKVSLTLTSRVTNETVTAVAFVLPKLSLYSAATKSHCTSWPHIAGLPLADPRFAASDQVEILLGAEVCSVILEEGLKKGAPRAPIAQKTVFGWILSGGSSAATLHGRLHSMQCSVDHELTAIVRKFWEQEREAATPVALPPDDQRCEQMFLESHTRDQSGRYVVRLPFASPPTALHETRRPAERLLTAMEAKGARDRRFGELYRDFMAEYEALGHMEVVTTSQSNTGSCYLPHHGVLRESSTTTKLRVVFNGSQKIAHNQSLNSHFLVGANLLPSLGDVLLRWRRHRYAMISDIEKMYRQILVHPDDRDHQRILWRESTAKPVREYRLRTVTYGLACAPFLAIRTLRQLADDEHSRFPLGALALKNDCYVDDIVTGADTLADAIAVQTQLRELCTAGGFPLRKWAANDRAILEEIPREHRLEGVLHSWETDSHATLGLHWHPHDDAFSFSTRERKIANVTKRTALSETARLFDPLGWLAPVVIRAKIMLQSTWLQGVDWDTPLQASDELQWRRFLGELPSLTSIRVRRWVDTGHEQSQIELHGFADASERGYAAAVYVRVATPLETKVHLLVAKSKVAPVKQVSLPRLELCAAVMVASLAQHVRSVLNLPTAPIHLWSDSMVTIHWLRGHASRWKTYVANRVSHIQELLPEARWHHVPGRENPADCASRGIAPSELADHPLWWTGPSWLKEGQSAWPAGARDIDDVELPERREPRLATAVTASLKTAEEIESEILLRFSSLQRLLRVTAWCCRWMRTHTRTAENHTTLQANELESALQRWLRISQARHFSQELADLSANRTVSQRSQLGKLCPFIDEQGVMRVGGRLKHALLTHDERHPMIIPPESWITKLIVESCHLRTLHGGVQLTLGLLRTRFWLPRGRAVTKRILHRCTTCARWRADTPQPQMGSLPSARVTPARPFLRTGLDYAGPVWIRTAKGRGHKAHKGYIAVFVCFCTRAVHLEAVSDYTSDAFLAAFRRFISRRGRCSDLFSDCGTNFTGADKELRRLFQASSSDGRHIAHIATTEGIKWHFNPPAAPHFGGLWEAAVKSTKHHLRRVIGDSTLTYEEMATFLAQVEACLNSRPLQALSDDPADVSALTPGHFLVGAPLLALPEPPLNDHADSTLSRWRMLQKMRDHFWQRWSAEYIHGLNPRTKWLKTAKPPEVGNLCLIRSEVMPPSRWPLARIVAVHPGTDGIVRVVTVRTATSEFTRPLCKIVLLPGAAG